MGLHHIPTWLVVSTDYSALLLSLPLALLALPIITTIFHYLLDDLILRSNITGIILLQMTFKAHHALGAYTFDTFHNTVKLHFECYVIS